MTVGIVGLGLIGGSMAKAYHAARWRVLACEKDVSVIGFAEMTADVDGELTIDSISQCDLVLLAVYPRACIDFLRENAPQIDKNTMVIDCSGTKRTVCEACFPIADQYGFPFLGGHPMAGTHHSGFKYARQNLFRGAPMVLVPPRFDDIDLLQKAKELLLPAGFGSISVTSAEKHDEMIAFTSQLAHIVSNAYIKSPTAGQHKGFSAGSYKDLTRVAWLNPSMWAELFLENRDNLTRELDILIEHLRAYRDAMTENDEITLQRLLDEGRKRKQEVDG